MFLQVQNEFVEKEVKLAKERRQAEKELYQKNRKLRELIEEDEIEVFKMIKGHDMGNRCGIFLTFFAFNLVSLTQERMWFCGLQQQITEEAACAYEMESNRTERIT